MAAERASPSVVFATLRDTRNLSAARRQQLQLQELQENSRLELNQPLTSTLRDQHISRKTLSDLY